MAKDGEVAPCFQLGLDWSRSVCWERMEAKWPIPGSRPKYRQQKYDHIVDILQDQPRQGRPIRFDHKVEAHVSMIACSEAPTGAARWTLQLIADKLVQLNVVDSISHESVRSLLKKTNLSLG